MHENKASAKLPHFETVIFQAMAQKLIVNGCHITGTFINLTRNNDISLFMENVKFCCNYAIIKAGNLEGKCSRIYIVHVFVILLISHSQPQQHEKRKKISLKWKPIAQILTVIKSL